MNKNAIQKYAVWARNELIEQIKQRAYEYGITKDGYGEENTSVISGYVLTNDEKNQRNDFITEIKKHGFQKAIEEVAYTWFNRFIALRYMEVNDYLPTHIRIFSDSNGNFNPEILTDVLNIDLDGLDKTKVSELFNDNRTEDLYRYLLLTQCNALNKLLPDMFEKMGAYTEMLLPNNILKSDGVIGRLLSDIDEVDFKDAVQIIGWMYQYYNTEPKQEVFDGLKKNIKITRENIPAATQLFTPDWIVKYMVENSLGRLWLESYPNITLRNNWKYYVDEAEQSPEVAEQLLMIRTENTVKSPEDIKVIDPCMGSGHILVYAFDVLIQIYTSEGYSERDAAKLILEKNIYGLEIDRRAYQLAYFALMMKARQYNRRILTFGIKPQLYEPHDYDEGLEYGSLLRIDELEDEPIEDILQLDDIPYSEQLNTWNFRRLLSMKYDVVVTNPPYMGSSGMNSKLAEYVKKHYPDSKSDLFAAFIEQGGNLIKPSGYQAMITQHAWMFLSSYEKLRSKLLHHTIINMAHLGARAFEEIGGEVVQTTSFVMSKNHVHEYKGTYARLIDYNSQNEKEEAFLSGNNRYTATTDNFAKIPGSPVAYWVSENMLRVFDEGIPLSEISYPKQGLATADNDRFLRLWFESPINNIKFNAINAEDALLSEAKWFPYNKGGEFRKWYGNKLVIINWENNGQELILFEKSVVRNINTYFNEGMTYSDVSSSDFSFRYVGTGFIYDSCGPMVFCTNKISTTYLLGIMNSIIINKILKMVCPTIHFTQSSVAKSPIIINETYKPQIESIVTENISISRTDWDAFETSWDFVRHPLVKSRIGATQRLLKHDYEHWERECNDRFTQLKSNEEELNRIFIDIYGLNDELTPEVEDKDVTVRRADLKRDIRSLISYAVGCMFGRYSLDVDGLAYAGGEWNADNYHTFIPDKDNVIPICDDEYFEDDIVNRFVDFIRVVYGNETLESNLDFIAEALGGNDSSRDVIRKYFLNDFYKDHLKIYQKRPIYWQFDSGKKNGFKALIYMHRYARDTMARVRTDYVHEQQERYRTQLKYITDSLNTANGSERADLLKQQKKLSEQAVEISAYEEKVHHLADRNIEIDLDDGVKKNYAIFEEVLAKI